MLGIANKFTFIKFMIACDVVITNKITFVKFRIACDAYTRN